MPDSFSKDVRSRIMASVHSKRTKPELKLKSSLKGLGFRFQPKIYGNPDFANKSKRVALFVDGCFWHKCKRCYTKPKSNSEFWLLKASKNASRDKKITKHLKKEGWLVLRFWEHQVNKSSDMVAELVRRKLKNRK